ncbi:YihY/virulence factor BrkB family protein [Gaiella sp.]|uniref:YihY/virulence factor BrkB family protein n=1 Tax=Gaiella sp. TaxID=2663207 RepID=UPI00326455FF
MSTASRVPETWELTGDDARLTLASTGRVRLLKDALVRLRAADGTSHSRSLAFVLSLVLVQGLIVIVGFAAAFGSSTVSAVTVDIIRTAAPGPAGDFLTGAVKQANTVGGQDRFLVLLIGLVGLTITATTTMGQLERGLNRIYGVERDRPFVEKYRLAFLLAVSAGAVIAASFVLLAFGRTLGISGDGAIATIWSLARWPLGVGLLAVGLAILFRWAPRRRQPSHAWLAFGSTVAVTLLTVVTLVLALAFRVSSSFGDTYGPLAGIVALQFWTLVSALSIFYGAAVAAQLEAVRAGSPAPASRVREADDTPARQRAATIA